MNGFLKNYIYIKSIFVSEENEFEVNKMYFLILRVSFTNYEKNVMERYLNYLPKDT